MFDDTIRLLKELERGEHVTLSVTIPPDEDGFIDRQCADSRCDYAFKVQDEDWGNLVQSNGQAHCPRCGCQAKDDSWRTHEQIAHLREQAKNHVAGRIGKALKRDADRFNRRQRRGGLISMSMEARGRPRTVSLPRVAEVMQVKITCTHCTCRFAVVSALQRYLDRLYESRTGQPPVKNAFQRLGGGSELWKAEVGKTYDDLIGIPDMVRLKRHFQQRHLLAHRQGIVDAEYIQKSGDSSYQAGQRLVLKGHDVEGAADLIERLGAAVAAEL